jgi:Rrf2 family transcriptional regulator, cysteine metabolism repressor
MKLSTRGRYGTRLLLDLAFHQDDGPVLLADVARRQHIPLPYLKHLISPLVGGGVVRSARGAKGGISLVKPPEEIRLSEVIQLLEGSIAPVDCIDDPGACERSSSCVTRDVWMELQKAMDNVLGATTLSDLMERQKEKENPMPEMYNI